MKLKLQFIVVAFIALVVYIPVAHGQANPTFSGGSGTPLVTTLTNSVVYTITNTNCATATVLTPYFNFDEAGNTIPAFADVSGTMSFSTNGGALQLIGREGSDFTGGDTTANDLSVSGSVPTNVANGSTVVLSGTVTTDTNVVAARPTNGSYITFITNDLGVRCSSNGVAAAPTAAIVLLSGHVTSSLGRGITGVNLSLTDSQGKYKNICFNCWRLL